MKRFARTNTVLKFSFVLLLTSLQLSFAEEQEVTASHATETDLLLDGIWKELSFRRGGITSVEMELDHHTNTLVPVNVIWNLTSNKTWLAANDGGG